MTDLDNTQILTADESLIQENSTNETEASLKVIHGAESNTYPLANETIIGRGNPSTLVLSAPSLSKQHAKIHYSNGQYFITDLGSSNKTFQNKVQLQANVCYALHNGDEIKLGDLLCTFHEEKISDKKDNGNQSEAVQQSYVPVVNTLVEEDSPWNIDQEEEDDIVPPKIQETKVEVIPSTQTISDSYDDEAPTQPMKIWNGNSNNVNRLSRTSNKSANGDEMTNTSNGAHDAPCSTSSAFVATAAPTVPVNDEDDGSLVIGSSTHPATVPLVIEPTQVLNEDQLEIVSSVQTKQVVEEIDENSVRIETTTTTTTTMMTTSEVDIDNAHTDPSAATGEVKSSNGDLAETQPYEMESETIITDVVETKKEEIHQVVLGDEEVIEKVTTVTKTTTKTVLIEEDNPPMQTLAYDLQPTATLATDETQAYDLDEQVERSSTAEMTETSSSIETKNAEEKSMDIEIRKEPTIPQMDVEQTQINDEMDIPAATQINADMDAPVQTLPNDQMESTETQINEEMDVPAPTQVNTDMDAPVQTLVNDQMESAQTQINTDMDAPAQTLVNDQMESTETQINDDMDVGQTQPNEEMEVEKVTEPAPTSEEAAPISAPTKDETEKEPVSSTNDEAEKAVESDSRTIPTDETETSTKTDAEERPTESQEELEEHEDDAEEGDDEEKGETSTRPARGVPRRNARRARGRRAAGKARVVSNRIYGGRRNPVPAPSTEQNEANNTTLEETIQTETEESPTKPSETTETEAKSEDTQPTTPVMESPTPNLRVSARIKARASSGRNRQFPYTDDYVDLDDLEKQAKAASSSGSLTRKSSRGAGGSARSSNTLQKRISLRQQAAETSDSPDETNKKSKDPTEVHEDMETGGENEAPVTTEETSTGRKRKSTTPVASASATKRTRSSTTPRGKQTLDPDASASSSSTTPKRTRKSAKEEPSTTEDRPVRIALSSHLNFDQNYLDALKKLGFEIMDESCHVDALVVDRIRRTKKFFMCLARGAHILSPTWIESMIKENRYLPYEKFYLEDTVAETRYGFELRESVRLAKERPVFANYRVFCTKGTSPPYEDLKDIVEAAGGKFIEKINFSKPGKDLICIVAPAHKNEYEDLFRKGVPIVSEEFALSGISKQKLDFESFSIFQNAPAATGKSTGTK